MFELLHPWFLVLLPLPILVHLALPAYRKRSSAIKVSFFQRIVELGGVTPSNAAVVSQRIFYRLLVMIVIWLCILIALARPQYLGEPISHEKSARDLMVAVDLSGSMQTTDFVNEQGQSIDRLTAVKTVLAEFVEQRPHDRLGLIVFGDAPFLQAPFTQDHASWATLLDEAEIGMAGMSTAFGDAIGLAIKHFQHNSSENRVLIVLTDGNDTGSSVPPMEAAKVAQRYRITIYPIAIGDPETLGEEALDSVTLQRVAEITNGVFYHALDRQQLSNIYQRIAALEPQKFAALSFRPRQDLYYYPLSLVILLMFIFLGISLLQSRATVTHGSAGGD